MHSPVAAHIAVLDDEVEITRLLANYLQSQGFRVTQLHDGSSLMALLNTDLPSLVLLDLGLPGEEWVFDCAAGARALGEYDLLCALALNPARVLSRDFLLEQTRGREAAPFDRTIDVQVGRLRRKLEADAENPQIIKSVRGAGYIFVAAVVKG